MAWMNGMNESQPWLPWQSSTLPVYERGYMHVALAWVHEWDVTTRERIMIEKHHRLEDRSTHAKLPYMIAHNDWRGVVRWVHALECLHTSAVNRHGALEARGSSTAEMVALVRASLQ